MTDEKNLAIQICKNCGYQGLVDLKANFYKIQDQVTLKTEWKFQVQAYCTNCKRWITHLKQTDSVMTQLMIEGIIKNTKEGYDMKESFKKGNQKTLL